MKCDCIVPAKSRFIPLNYVFGEHESEAILFAGTMMTPAAARTGSPIWFLRRVPPSQAADIIDSERNDAWRFK
jgi:hypothetical protein